MVMRNNSKINMHIRSSNKSGSGPLSVIWRIWEAASVRTKVATILIALLTVGGGALGVMRHFHQDSNGDAAPPTTPTAQTTKTDQSSVAPPSANPSTTPTPTPPTAKPGGTGGGTSAPATGSSGATGGTTSGGGSGGSSCALPNYPTASCTGVPAGTNLTIINGDLEIKTAGTVVDSKDIRGCVIVQAANVTIRKSKITCTSFYGIASYAASDDGGLLVQDVEVDCADHNSTGISYEGLTVQRAHIHNCENGLDIYRNVTITDSYIHSIYEGATGHGDGIQSSDGSNTLIDHNTIYGESTTSAININNNPSGPTSTNITISNNLLAGGAYTLYCPIRPTVNFKILNNHFSRIFYATSGAYGPNSDCTDESQISGNIWHETGQPVSF
jgi:hypothetical protein